MSNNLQISKTGAAKKLVAIVACMFTTMITQGTPWTADSVTELELAKSHPKVQERLQKEELDYERNKELSGALPGGTPELLDAVSAGLDLMGLNPSARVMSEREAKVFDRRAVEIYREVMAAEKKQEEDKANQIDLHNRLLNLPHENPFEKLIDTSSWDKQVSTYKREATGEIGDASRRIDQQWGQTRQDLARQLDQARKNYGGSPDAAAGAPGQIALPSLNSPLSSGWQPAPSQPAASQPTRLQTSPSGGISSGQGRVNQPKQSGSVTRRCDHETGSGCF